nr:glycosyltransferase family 4 protein [Curtobacterium sp. WW7]
MSVLVLGINYSPETTGIAPYTSGLASELARGSNRVRVITTFPHYPQWEFHGGRPPRVVTSVENGVRVVRRRHVLPRRPGGIARALSELSFGASAAVTRFGRADIIVLVSPALISSALLLLKARLMSRRPVVLWVQDLYSLGLRELGSGQSSLSERVVAAVERWCLRSADAVVVIHERFRDTLVQTMGVRAENVTVVRNWSHVGDGDVIDRDATRAALGWAHDDFVVLHAGNMGVKQGLENVVDAAREVGPGSKVRFVLLGDGSQRDHLVALGADVPAVSFVESLADDEFLQALGSADALLVNERAGVSGMAVPSKLTSYFSTGLPVIAATDPGSVTESEVRLAEAGPVVAAGNPGALLATAEALAADPTSAAKWGANGLRFRAERLTDRASFDTFTQLLRRLVRPRARYSSKESGNV